MSTGMRLNPETCSPLLSKSRLIVERTVKSKPEYQLFAEKCLNFMVKKNSPGE
jgi:hypothetical protein